MENTYINLKVISKVALALGDLNSEVMYVGGAVVSLYATDEGAEQPRPTKDIDISVQVSSYLEMDKLRERLARKGIFPAMDEKVIYRYKYEDVLLDFIPMEATALGPTNSWLKSGFDRAVEVELEEATIRILPVDLFLASKWEAYKNRGTDPRTSNDFEDIVYVLDNYLNLMLDVEKGGQMVKEYLARMAKEILSEQSLNEIIECHINPFTSKERGRGVISKLKELLKYLS